MITVRKGKLGEEKLILDVANKAFIPYRNKDFNFINVMPKVYNNNLNFSNNHFVALDDNKIIAVAGNLINDINGIKYSLVGSVGTLQEESGKGAMKAIMKNIDLENQQENVIYSVLTGVRKRYNYFGYEQGPTRMIATFDNYFLTHTKINEKISLQEYKNEDLDSYYNLYLKYQPLILRKKENFTKSLLRRDAKLLGIYKDNILKGYLVVSPYKGWIEEISIDELSDIDTIIIQAMNFINVTKINVLANMLDINLVNALDKIASEVNLTNYLNIKVYDMVTFLDFIINLNLKTRHISDLSEVYKIDNKVIEITIKNDVVNVNEVNKEYLKEFNSKEFIRYMFNLTNRESKLFPLFFDINEGDLF